MYKRLNVYKRGIIYSSICTNITDRDEIVRRMNEQEPAGVPGSGLKWEISEEAFRGGEPNPSPCNRRGEDYVDYMHYLMVC